MVLSRSFFIRRCCIRRCCILASRLLVISICHMVYSTYQNQLRLNTKRNLYTRCQIDFTRSLEPIMTITGMAGTSRFLYHHRRYLLGIVHLGIIYKVEISLKKFMELWEQRNQDVHGKTEAQQKSRRLQKLRIEIRKLHSLQDQTRPSDDI